MTERATEDADTPSTPTSSAGEETPATLAGSHVVSTLRTVGTRVASWVRHSALYRWLTAEPDPDVIVIDLRETRTVGPILHILDWVIDRLAGAAKDSRAVAAIQRGITVTAKAPLRAAGLGIAAVGLLLAAGSVVGDASLMRIGVGVALAVAGLVVMQDDRDWATLRATRPVKLLIAAFEPPELPESPESSESREQSESPESSTPSESANRPQTSSRQQQDDQTIDTTDETQGIPLGENAPDERPDER